MRWGDGEVEHRGGGRDGKGEHGVGAGGGCLDHFGKGFGKI